MSANAPQAYARPLPRPSDSLLRRPLQNFFKKHIAIAIGLSVVGGVAYKTLVGDDRKRRYKEFYQTWDNERHFKRMIQAGVLQSIKPDSEVPDWVKSYEEEVDQAINALKQK